VYAPNNLLSNTFSGPYRVTSVSEKGAILRDIKSGDICSVSFEHLRKITFNELLSLIPGNFEAEIMKQLDQYRYNRKEREVEEKVERQVEEPWQEKKLRSGKTYSIKIEELNNKWTAAQEWCQRKGIRFRVLNEDQIFQTNKKRTPKSRVAKKIYI
jgi:hypothetical protein